MIFSKKETEKILKEGNGRVVIENIYPEIDGGRFPIKKVIKDRVKIKADLLTDGHNLISGRVLYKNNSDIDWNSGPLTSDGDDTFIGDFKVTELGVWEYTIIAWINEFATWQRDMEKRLSADSDIKIDLKIGVELLEGALKKAPEKIKKKLEKTIALILNTKSKIRSLKAALDNDLIQIMGLYGERKNISVYEKNLLIIVDPEIAGFSAWYEMFPRGNWGDCEEKGTFKIVEKRLDYIKNMGFNVLYFPPIHPIGSMFRKGKNNSEKAETGDVGSPWAIGGIDGGHKSVLAELGTIKDFNSLVKKARKKGVYIALDLAYQCSPDHPYVKRHPEWFKKRPDNSIQYAENPPKKYQDIYPIDFSTKKWKELWEELKSIVLYWIDQGVTIFRVDNPHTKSLSFWEWMITSIKKDHPEIVFLAEAFTRPKMMYRLAKLGFSQSYTYFTWRNTKAELTTYLTELTKTQKIEYFRPNFWPNTPDILNEYLQMGGEAAFKIRLILAALLSPNYGIYGPVFELCKDIPVKSGSEEYLNSEKYEIRKWDIKDPGSISTFISKINKIRNENRVFRSIENLDFFNIDNENLISFAKYNDDLSEIYLIIVNLDTDWKQSGWLEFKIDKFNIAEKRPYQVFDQLNNKYYIWNGTRNFIELDPKQSPAHIFKLKRFQKTEKNFDYYV